MYGDVCLYHNKGARIQAEAARGKNQVTRHVRFQTFCRLLTLLGLPAKALHVAL